MRAVLVPQEVAAVVAWEGNPPLGLKVVRVEGEEAMGKAAEATGWAGGATVPAAEATGWAGEVMVPAEEAMGKGVEASVVQAERVANPGVHRLLGSSAVEELGVVETVRVAAETG